MNSYRSLANSPILTSSRCGSGLTRSTGSPMQGAARARRVLLHVLGRAEELGINIPALGVTDYVNTIPATEASASRATRSSSGASDTSFAGTRR